MAPNDPARAFVEACLAGRRSPGASWWCGSGDVAASHGAAGFAAVEPSRERLDEATPFDLASLTKPLATALLAVMLEREERIDLEGKAAALLPELDDSDFEDATFLDLGAHRAGLPAWRPLYARASTRESFLAAIAGETLEATPRGALYSDLGYILLGVAIERAAGLTLDALFDAWIAKPLGLTATGFPGTGWRFAKAAATERGNAFERALAGREGAGHMFREHVIRGHVHDGNAWRLGGVAGHAGLFATAAEVAAIAAAALDGGRLGLDARARARLTVPVAGPGTRTFGFARSEDTESAKGILPDGSIGHLGFTGCTLWIEPGPKRIHVLLTNRVHPAVPPDDFVDVRRGFLTASESLLTGGA